MKGTVIKSTGRWCQVLSDEGVTYNCSIKGKFRVQGLRSTNPVAVGDIVHFTLEKDDEGVINKIEDRRNYLIRKSVNLSKQIHIIASNIDICWLVVTLDAPPTSTGFIDRFLISAQAFNVPVNLVFNKCDLFEINPELRTTYDMYVEGYRKAGYKSFEVSALSGKGLEEIKQEMTGKVNTFAGHSGVGKSTLANAIQPGLELRTMEVSDFHQKGQHTTTFAEMHPLDFGGFLIDTPGIKGFGLVDIDKDELATYFPEMFELLSECKFHNCRHLSEPGCAVKAAVENGDIADFRYKNYKNMVDQMSEDQHYRIDPYK